MPEYLHTGVYVEEIPRGPKPIEGVPTSTAAFIGETERGSTAPRLVTSFSDYARWFGGTFGNTKFMPFAVSGFFLNGGQRLYICRVTNAAATCAQASFGASFIVRSTGPGSWGQRVYAKVDDSSIRKPGPNGTLVPVGFRLRLAYYATSPSGDPLDWFNDATKPPLPDVAETFDNLELNENSPNDWYRQVNEKSALAELVPTGHGTSPPAKQFAQLATDGTDGAALLDVADYEGNVQLPPRAAPQGLAALEFDAYRDVALVYAPGASVAVNNAVISHCEKLRYRFAVLDADKAVDVTGFHPQTEIRDTQYAALYYPWLAIADPETGARIEVPPGGHVIGVYARSDAERGVFKMPANEVVRGVMAPAADINDLNQGIINPRGINAIRRFAGRGIRVWGARTLSSDPLWKYVNVRRLFIFLERSICEGTQWVVFEPNNDQLWPRVRDTVRLFLRAQWRLGALQGRTEQDAFFISCDRNTMTQADILEGRLICEIGIAPVRPAEFVIFRLLHRTAEASA